MHKNCPGSMNITTPELKVKACPSCGFSIEVFSDEVEVKCGRCGQQVYNDIQSCVQWCKYAIDCVGAEAYNKFKK